MQACAVFVVCIGIVVSISIKLYHIYVGASVALLPYCLRQCIVLHSEWYVVNMVQTVGVSRASNSSCPQGNTTPGGVLNTRTTFRIVQ